MANTPCPWWGKFVLPEGSGGRFRIGPLRFTVQRRTNEWRIASIQVADHLDTQLEMEVPASAPFEEEGMAVDRFGFETVPDHIRISPSTADRSVAARPITPFHILPERNSTLYISTPLWARFSIDGVIDEENTEEFVHEVPLFRPSDTWVGPDTTSGELCYAARTPAVLERQRLVHLPHRVTTQVQIRNRHGGPFLVERITLPVPNFSVFMEKGGGLWTENLSIHRVDDDVKVKISSGPPRFCDQPMQLALPRVPFEHNIVVRAFSRLFG